MGKLGESIKDAVAGATDDPETGVQESWGKGMATLAAVFGALATTLTTFATANGGLARMFRDRPGWSQAAVVLVGLGALLAVPVPALRPGTSRSSARFRSHCFAAASTLLLLGLSLGVLTAVASAGTRQRPSIVGEVTADPVPVLVATVSVQGLRSRDTVHVSVHGFRAGGQPVEHVYQAEVGADTDGKVALSLRRPFAVGAYQQVMVQAWSGGRREECNAVAGERSLPSTASTSTGCLLLLLPEAPTRPLLTATWKGKGPDRTLAVTGSAAGTQVTSTMVVRVTDPKGKVLYSGSVGADATGAMKLEAAVPVPAGARGPMCVAAGMAATGPPPTPTCDGTAAAWALPSPA